MTRDRKRELRNSRQRYREDVEYRDRRKAATLQYDRRYADEPLFNGLKAARSALTYARRREERLQAALDNIQARLVKLGPQFIKAQLQWKKRLEEIKSNGRVRTATPS